MHEKFLKLHQLIIRICEGAGGAKSGSEKFFCLLKKKKKNGKSGMLD